MSLEQVKKGGPYSKKDQEKRRSEAYRLHFEKSYSAIKIAEFMKVNRNTINEDIKYWYSRINSEIQGLDLDSWMARQVHRLEIQRGRIIDDIEKTDTARDRMVLEKLLYEIDSKLTTLVSKMISTAKPNTKPTEEDREITEEQVKEITREIITSHISLEYSKRELIYRIIWLKKCDVAYAKRIIYKMIELGLGVCGDQHKVLTERHDLIEFAEIREYFSDSELDEIFQRIKKREKEIEIFKKVRDEFSAKHGTDNNKWSEEVLEKFRNQIKKETENDG